MKYLVSFLMLVFVTLAADVLFSSDALAVQLVPTKPTFVPAVVAPAPNGPALFAQNPVAIKLSVPFSLPATAYLVTIERKNAQGVFQYVTNFAVSAAEAHSPQGYLGWGGAGIGRSPQSIAAPGNYRIRAQVTAPKASGSSDWVEFKVMSMPTIASARMNNVVVPQIQISPQARGYTDCGVIASSGYVSSYSVMRFYARTDDGQKRMSSQRGDKRYDLALTRNASEHTVSARGVKTLRYDTDSAPVYFQRIDQTVSPPQIPQAPASPVRERAPFRRIMPDNPYACAIGSASVSPVVPGATPKAGDVVTLVVTSFVGAGRGIWNYVEDTYRLPTAGNKPVTFANIAVQAIRTSKDAQEWRDLFDDFKQNRRTTLIGLSAFYNLNEAVRLACMISAPIDRTTMGTISCPPGTNWPIY